MLGHRYLAFLQDGEEFATSSMNLAHIISWWYSYVFVLFS